jgi:predicted amidohydrolase
MRVGFLQMKPTFGRVSQNLSRAAGFLEKIREATVVLPELFNSGYLFMSREELASVAEPVPRGPTTRKLKVLARKNKLHLVFGIPEKHGRLVYNSSVLVTPKGKVHVYRKVHLFDREKLFFTPGNAVWKKIPTPEASLGMMICFDWRFPEACRILALKGVQIVCHPSALIHPYCQDAMRTRCIENRVFAITANRVGKERRGAVRVEFTGRSQIVDPGGEILVSAGETSESLKLVEIDPAVALNKEITANNDLLKDRRVRFYRSLASSS